MMSTKMSTTPKLLERVRSLLKLPIENRELDYLQMADFDRETCLQFIRELNTPWQDEPESMIWEYMSDEEWQIGTQHDEKVEEGHVLCIYLKIPYMEGLEMEEREFGKIWFLHEGKAHELFSYEDRQHTSHIAGLNYSSQQEPN